MHMKYREVLEVFMKRLPKQSDGDDVFRANAELLFRACIELLKTDDDGRFDVIAAARLLNQIELGSGCWLDDVEAAIALAKDDFPSHYALFYERFSGAAGMAHAYLLNLDWMEINSRGIVAHLKSA
jgi:hypothetical protein